MRVLANVRPDAYRMNIMLHEFAHAVYDRHINPRLSYFLRTYAHMCTTEAVALMMGSLSEEPGWLLKVAAALQEVLDAEKLAAQRGADRLVFTRWALMPPAARSPQGPALAAFFSAQLKVRREQTEKCGVG